VVSFLTNVYLKKNYKQAFAKNESFVENGLSEIKESEDKKYTYRLNEDGTTAVIISYLGNDAENIVIPNMIDGCTVSSLGEASFAYHDELKSITVPDTVNSLELAVFGSCPDLEKVYFTSDVENINEWAFGDFSGTIVANKNSNLSKCAKDQKVVFEERK
jgi:hypothetical protein